MSEEELEPDVRTAYPSLFGNQPIYVGVGTGGLFDSSGGSVNATGFGFGQPLFGGSEGGGTGSLFSGVTGSGSFGSGGIFGSTEAATGGFSSEGASSGGASQGVMTGGSAAAAQAAASGGAASGAQSMTMTPEQILTTMMNTMSVQAQVQSTALQKLVERLEQLEQQQRAQPGSSSHGQGQGSFRPSPFTDEKPFNISIPAANASGWRNR